MQSFSQNLTFITKSRQNLFGNAIIKIQQIHTNKILTITNTVTLLQVTEITGQDKMEQQ